MIPIGQVLAISAVLFTLGVVGVLIRRSTLVVFMSIEIMLNAANLAFVALSRAHAGMEGQVFAFFVMAVAAAEAAVGLAIIVAIFRRRHSTDMDQLALLKW